MSDQIPSRLHSQVRGVGAAYATNQKRAGVSDPHAAAQRAAMDPEAVDALDEQAAMTDDELSGIRAEMLDHINSTSWRPKADVPSGANWDMLLDRQPESILREWHKEYKAHVDKQIEDLGDKMLRDTFGGIGAESHLYEPLTDKSRRIEIEKRLAPIEFETMVFHNYAEQDVKVRDNFVLTFRTITTQHGLWLEYYMSQLEDTSMQHIRHLFSLLQVAASLDKVNGKSIGSDLSKFVKPTHRDEFIAAIEAKQERLGGMPAVLTDDIIVQYIWFSGRVRKVLSGNLMGKVGNS